MFYQPRHPYSRPQACGYHCHEPTSASLYHVPFGLGVHPSSRTLGGYEDYDAYRSLVERDALLERQAQRRAQEEAIAHQFRLRQEAECRKEEREQFLTFLAQRQRAAQEQARRKEAYLNAVKEKELAKEAFIRGELERRGYQRRGAEELPRVEFVFGPSARCSGAPVCGTKKVDVKGKQPSSAPAAKKDDIVRAAIVVQRTFRTHKARSQHMSEVEALSHALEEHIKYFALPSELVFDPSSPAKLAYAASNGPFLAYEHHLVQLLSKADEIVSNGDERVKSARKAFVKMVEEQLEMLDGFKNEQWAKVAKVAEEPGKEAATAEKEDVVMVEDATEIATSPAPVATDEAEGPAEVKGYEVPAHAAPVAPAADVEMNEAANEITNLAPELTESKAIEQDTLVVDPFEEVLDAAQGLGAEVERKEAEEVAAQLQATVPAGDDVLLAAQEATSSIEEKEIVEVSPTPTLEDEPPVEAQHATEVANTTPSVNVYSPVEPAELVSDNEDDNFGDEAATSDGEYVVVL